MKRINLDPYIPFADVENGVLSLKIGRELSIKLKI